ncbi:murein biosynthesis integral membrane protein MurJ [Kiritimatiellaeota bacterium B1221]|nr:murein biosynthesis integral membrane protein MurJ [Kiritimatiellaeota bacterium B1221]
MKTENRLFRNTGLVSLGTLSSRLLGLVREMMMAWVFGVGLVGSAFVVAFTIPNLFRRLFGEGALSAAFIPSYIRVKNDQGPQAGWQLTRNVLSLLVIVLGSITLAGMLLCTIALQWNALPEKLEAVLLSLRILLPYMIWICLAAIAMGVLNAHRKYMVPAFAPCILNLLWILALAGMQFVPGLYEESKVIWICWAILVAGLLQFLVQLPPLRKLGYQPGRTIEPFDPEVKAILRLMGPAALGAAIVQINVVIDRILALWVADYGPLALSYSERLIYLPLGLFATALGTILLPEFSHLVQARDRIKLGETLEKSLRGLMFVMIPAAAGLACLAIPIVRLVYERGQFDATSTVLTSRALACYAPGLIVFSAAKIFVPLYYAHGDTRTPVKIGALTVLANLLMNLLFIALLPSGWKHAGLALGTVLSSLLQVIILAFIARKRFADVHWLPIGISWVRQAGCCLPMIYVAWTLLHVTDHWTQWLSVPLAIAAAALVYLLCAWVIRCPELRELRHQ